MFARRYRGRARLSRALRRLIPFSANQVFQARTHPANRTSSISYAPHPVNQRRRYRGASRSANSGFFCMKAAVFERLRHFRVVNDQFAGKAAVIEHTERFADPQLEPLLRGIVKNV